MHLIRKFIEIIIHIMKKRGLLEKENQRQKKPHIMTITNLEPFGRLRRARDSCTGAMWGPAIGPGRGGNASSPPMVNY